MLHDDRYGGHRAQFHQNTVRARAQKETRFDLRLSDFENAVESSIEAGLILLSDYFDSRIDFIKNHDVDKKINWSKYNEPRIQLFLEKLLLKIEIKQGIDLNVREISGILRKDLDFAKQTLQPV